MVTDNLLHIITVVFTDLTKVLQRHTGHYILQAEWYYPLQVNWSLRIKSV